MERANHPRVAQDSSLIGIRGHFFTAAAAGGFGTESRTKAEREMRLGRVTFAR
jgi:hypothetical protein